MWEARGPRSAKTFESGASEESTLLNLLAMVRACSSTPELPQVVLTPSTEERDVLRALPRIPSSGSCPSFLAGNDEDGLRSRYGSWKNFADGRGAASKGTCCLTVGCFDMFHRGHAKLLKRLTSECDKLIVGVHDDESIWLNKGVRVSDTVTKRFATVQLALRPQDEAFIIRAQDPTPYWVGGTDSRGRPVEGMLEKARAEGWSRFEYKRGDDMLNFPGRQALQREGVTVKFLPYTQGVSASKMRRMWGLNMQARRRPSSR